jgi:large subunit ribosomal protein L26e
MKYSASVSGSRRKSRKAHFAADSESKRRFMSAMVSKDLRKEHGIRSLPIRKDDEVTIVRGDFKGREGRVTTVYRLKNVIHVERVQVEKANGAPVPVGIHPSNCVITKIKEDRDRKAVIARKKAGRASRRCVGRGAHHLP